MSDEIDVGAFNRSNAPPESLRQPLPIPNVEHIDNVRGCLARTMKLNIRETSNQIYQSEDQLKKEELLREGGIIEPHKGVLDSVDINGIIEHWNTKGFKRIVTLGGPGTSALSEIPDYRSADSTIYKTMRKYKLPNDAALFQLDYLIHKPEAFYEWCKAVYPGQYRPTVYHYFIKMLHAKNLLVRHYTQNIDMLDRLVGIPVEKLVEVNGTFNNNHCIDCGLEHSMDWMREQLQHETFIPKCTRCNSLVKPDLLFEGDKFSDDLHILVERDVAQCDLLIVMGMVPECFPFLNLFDTVGEQCVRLVIAEPGTKMAALKDFRKGEINKTRDVLYYNSHKEAIWSIVNGLNFMEELEERIVQQNKSQLSIVRSTDDLIVIHKPVTKSMYLSVMHEKFLSK